MALGTVAATLYAHRAAERPELRASAETLTALLRARGYPVHASVLAFDAAWGGVLIGDGPDEDPHADDEDYWLGAYACLTEGGHENPRGEEALGLVPVMYSPNDIIWYLDASGTAWVEDTIEGPGPVPCARSGEKMIASSLLMCSMWRREMQSLEIERAAGAEIAAALGLPALEEASDDLVRWWGDGVTLIVELLDSSPERDVPTLITRAVSDDPALLARWA